MKLFIYLFSIAVATLLFVAEDYFWFGASQGPQGVTGSQGVAHIPKYKVYTALLLQSGGGNELSLVFEGPNPPVTEVGVTYEIVQIGDYIDFTSIGAPDNNVGTKFIATEGSPGTGGSSSSILSYNTGAPVVTVLENTIGNIWFSYEDVGIYSVKSDGLFTENKTWNTPVITLGMGGTDHRGIMYTGGGSYSTPDPDTISIKTSVDKDNYANDLLNNTPIEIRVYN